MKEFRTKEMSIKIRFACVSPRYFYDNLQDYYDLLDYDFYRSKKHGNYVKFFYKLKSYNSPVFADLDDDSYSQLPAYVCKSTIY